MHAFDVLADPVRRRLLERLAEGECSSGDLTAVIQAEFGLTQSAVSQHLKVLRENGFATVRVDASRRIYALQGAAMRDVDVWLERFRSFWAPKLDALATEVARGKRERRGSPEAGRHTDERLQPAPPMRRVGGRRKA
jgi:DNA-binding transcriptional ArsR family regulator